MKDALNPREGIKYLLNLIENIDLLINSTPHEDVDERARLRELRNSATEIISAMKKGAFNERLPFRVAIVSLAASITFGTLTAVHYF